MTNVGPARADDRQLANVLCLLRVDPSAKFGGIEEQTLVLAQRFKDHDRVYLPVYQCAGQERPTIEHQAAGLPCEFMDFGSFGPSSLWRLRRLIQEHRISVVHWHFFHPLDPFVWGLSFVNPRLIHYSTNHSSTIPGDVGRTSPTMVPVKKWLFRRYARVWGVSNFLVDVLRGTGVWPRVERARHFINTDRFRPSGPVRREVRTELGVGNEFVVLVVAHLIAEKGVDVAIRSIAELPDCVELWIVGGGKEADELRTLAERVGAASRTRFLGNQRRVERFMQAADCLACPSIWDEAVGLSNLEALASGLPVVASAVGGIPEFIRDGHNGYLFERGDVAGMVQAIERLNADPAAREEMGINARNTAVDDFSIDARVDEYLEWYRSPQRS